MRLSMFAFWTALIGFVLVALTAIPGTEIPIFSEESSMPVTIGLILFVCGVSCFIMDSRFNNERSETEDSFSSVWRTTEELSNETQNVERNLSTDLHRRIDDLSDEMYRELEKCQNSCSRKEKACSSEDSVVTRSGLSAKTTGN